MQTLHPKAGRAPIEADDLVVQTERNVVAVLTTGNAGPEHLGAMTWYLTDLDAYDANLKRIGLAYRKVFGRRFPAMAVMQVARGVGPPREDRDPGGCRGASDCIGEPLYALSF